MTIPADYEALFAASPYPYLLVDTAYSIIGANPAYLQATKRTAADLLGKNIFDAFPANPADPDSTNLEEVRASIALAISTRQPHTSALLRYGIPHETPDGTVFEDRYWSAIHSPVFDKTGQVSFVSQNALDVTDLYRFDNHSRKYYLRQDVHVVDDPHQQQERSQMHEAMTRILSSERGQMQTLFHQAPGFIAVLNGADHTVELVNQAYYHLVGRRDLIGKTFINAMPELANEGFKELLNGVFGTGEGIVLRSQKVLLQRVLGAPLEERFVDLLCQPIRGTDGRVSGIFVQDNDVTNERKANTELAEKVEQLELAHRGQSFQLELADRLRPLNSSEEIIATANEFLGSRTKVSRVALCEINDLENTFRYGETGVKPGLIA